MIRSVALLIAVVLGTASFPVGSGRPSASGMVGIFGIVQRVQFEPNAREPERVRLWGAFAFVNGGVGGDPNEVTAARRGQLHFRLPPSAEGDQHVTDAVRAEWRDMQSVAGTGQAIAFGGWSYSGQFSPSAVAPAGFGAMGIAYAGPIAMWVIADSARAVQPFAYMPNVGVVKVSETGGYMAIVRSLRAAIR